MGIVTIGVLAVLGRGVVDPDAPVIRADDPGYARGDGCFEGIRVLTDAGGSAGVHNIDAHLARMARSAAAMDISFDPAAWRDLVHDALAHWHLPGEAAMRLVLSRGVDAPVGILTISELAPFHAQQRRDGLKVITLTRGTTRDAFADAPWLLGGVKTLSYAVNMAGQREAERRGCDDVIFVTEDGAVLEAPTSSVVWANRRTLRTIPTGPTGILASTTLHLLFDNAVGAGWDCGSELVTVEELHAADVLWLVSSVRGPVDIVELDGKPRTRRPEVDTEIRHLAGFAPATP